jgi:hypothetical protein
MAEAEKSSKQLDATKELPQKATLFCFIEKTSKLVTSFAALIALTLLCIQQMKGGGIETVLPGMTLAAAILVGLEWWAQLPAPPYHWRLELFRELLAAILVFTAGYWFVKFGALYVNVSIFALLSFALMALAAAISAVFLYILRLKKQGARRISYVVASLIILYFGWSTVVGHLIKIPLPNPRIFSRLSSGSLHDCSCMDDCGNYCQFVRNLFRPKDWIHPNNIDAGSQQAKLPTSSPESRDGCHD